MSNLSADQSYVQSLCDAVGNCYRATDLTIGNTLTPGGLAFEIQQIRSVAASGLPLWGCIGYNGDLYSYTDGDADLTLAEINLTFKSDRLTSNRQKISLYRSGYNELGDDYIYGLILGFEYQILEQFSKTYSFTALENAGTGWSVLNVSGTFQDNLFPIYAIIGNKYVAFSHYEDGYLYVDKDNVAGSGIGTSDAIILENDIIKYSITPRVSRIASIPISSINDSVNNENVFPTIPYTFLPILRCVVRNPGQPYIPTYQSEPAIQSLITVYSKDNTLTAQASRQIINECDDIINNLKLRTNSSTLRALFTGLEQYTKSVAPDVTDIGSYWSSLPLSPISDGCLGSHHGDATKFRFSDDFCTAYYSSMGVVLRNSAAMFRGDLYTSAVANGETLDLYTFDAENVFTLRSALPSGTMSYTVGTIIDESETVSLAKSINLSSSGKFVIVDATTTNPSYIYRLENKYPYLMEQQLINTPIANIEPAFYPITSDRVSSGDSNWAVKLTSFPNRITCLSLGLDFVSGTSGSVTITLHDGTNTPNNLLATLGVFDYADIKDQKQKLSLILSSAIDVSSYSSLWIKVHCTDDMSFRWYGNGVDPTALYALVNSSWILNGSVNPEVFISGGVIDYGQSGIAAYSRGIKRFTTKIPTLSRWSIRVCDTAFGVGQAGAIVDDSNGTATTGTTTDLLVQCVLSQDGLNSRTFTLTIPSGSTPNTVLPLTGNLTYDTLESFNVTPGNNGKYGAFGQPYLTVNDSLVLEYHT